MSLNIYLLVAAGLNFFAALLHLLIIYYGAPWYRFFGAGEKMAAMAEQGSMRPTFITLTIAIGLTGFGLYALAGSGLSLSLPFVKETLVLITAVFLLRSLAIIPALRPAKQLPSPAFWTWSSITVLFYGVFHLIGLIQGWSEL